MTIEKSSVGVDREHGVVKSAMTASFGHSFVPADVQHDSRFFGQATKFTGFRTGDGEAVFHEPRKNRFYGFVVPHGDVAAAIEPGGIARQPRFRKGNEFGPAGGCLTDESPRFLEGTGKIEKNRRGLHGGNTN